MKLEKKIFIERFYSNVKYGIDRKDLPTDADHPISVTELQKDGLRFEVSLEFRVNSR